ncbi:MAG TPA: hypothetical protein PLY45_05525, partial [bacterium]|nr:hypothetical protein [bacterium]
LIGESDIFQPTQAKVTFSDGAEIYDITSKVECERISGPVVVTASPDCFISASAAGSSEVRIAGKSVTIVSSNGETDKVSLDSLKMGAVGSLEDTAATDPAAGKSTGSTKAVNIFKGKAKGPVVALAEFSDGRKVDLARLVPNLSIEEALAVRSVDLSAGKPEVEVLRPGVSTVNGSYAGKDASAKVLVQFEGDAVMTVAVDPKPSAFTGGAAEEANAAEGAHRVLLAASETDWAATLRNLPSNAKLGVSVAWGSGEPFENVPATFTNLSKPDERVVSVSASGELAAAGTRTGYDVIKIDASAFADVAPQYVAVYVTGIDDLSVRVLEDFDAVAGVTGFGPEAGLVKERPNTTFNRIEGVEYAERGRVRVVGTWTDGLAMDLTAHAKKAEVDKSLAVSVEASGIATLDRKSAYYGLTPALGTMAQGKVKAVITGQAGLAPTAESSISVETS